MGPANDPAQRPDAQGVPGQAAPGQGEAGQGEAGQGEAGQGAARFDILEYQVEGNSVLPALAIERAVYPHLGPGRGLDDAEAARGALERAYRDAGYPTVLVDIPEQQVTGGVVRLAVTEGRVARTRVSGSRYYLQGKILAGVPSLAEGTVPHFPAVQREVAALNRWPGRKVVPALKPGAAPGSVDVDLKVQDQSPLSASLELNDRASASTSRSRLLAGVDYANLWQRGHSLEFNAQVSPEDTREVRVLTGSYLWRFQHSDRVLALYAVTSRSDVAAVGDVSVIGNSDIAGARYVVPLAASEGYYHSAVLGADYKDIRDDVTPGGATTVSTPISYLPLSLEYSGGATRDAGRTQTQARVGAHFGVRGLVGSEAEFEDKRFQARSDFFYLNGEASHTRALGGFEFSARLAGQWAGGPLVSNEQFSAGGAESVRGYAESEVLGDDGVFAGLEARTPNLAPRLKFGGEWRLLAFAEGARVRVRDPLPEQTHRFGLASLGVGLRVSRPPYSGALDWAVPLKDGAFEDPVAGSRVTEAGDARVHVRLWADF